MISANEVREKIHGEEGLFEMRAQAVADYLIDAVVQGAIEGMIKHRAHKAFASCNLMIVHPVLEELGLGHLKPKRFGDEFNLLTERAYEIANERIHEAGYGGRGFFEEQHGEPFYGGGHGVYYTMELEIEC